MPQNDINKFLKFFKILEKINFEKINDEQKNDLKELCSFQEFYFTNFFSKFKSIPFNYLYVNRILKKELYYKLNHNISLLKECEKVFKITYI